MSGSFGAVGARSFLYLQRETTYGTPPSGNWVRVPFRTSDLGGERALIDGAIISATPNRDAADPFRDTLTVSGSVDVPIDHASIGLWLRLLYGAPTTTGTAPNFVHTFGSGAATLPSYSAEVAFPDVNAFFVYTGLVANSMEIEFSPTGPATARIELMGQGMARNSSSSAGAPTSHNLSLFHRAQGSITRNAAALGLVTAASVRLANSLEPVRTIRDDLRVDGFAPGESFASGSITVRFANQDVFSQALDGTSCALQFSYIENANRQLTVALHRVFFSQPRVGISGPGGIETTLEFRGVYDATAQRAVTVTLRNGVSSYA